jgi:hypothetical protein
MKNPEQTMSKLLEFYRSDLKNKEFDQAITKFYTAYYYARAVLKYFGEIEVDDPNFKQKDKIMRRLFSIKQGFGSRNYRKMMKLMREDLKLIAFAKKFITEKRYSGQFKEEGIYTVLTVGTPYFEQQQ